MNIRNHPARLVFGALLAGLLLAWCRRGGIESGHEDWRRVEKVHTARVIREVGTLEALELARIQARISGVLSDTVEDGASVDKGEAIFSQDVEERRGRLDSEMENLEQSREDYESQVAEYAVLTNNFHIVTQLKLAERDHARLKLAEGSVPLTPEETRLLEIDISLAELDLKEKEDEWERQRELVKRNFAPPSSLDTIRLETTTARTFLEEKRSQYALATQPVSEEDRLTLKAALEKAEKAVARNQEHQERQLRIQKLKLEGLDLRMRHTGEQIARYEEELGQVTQYAPVAGIVRMTRRWSWSARSWKPMGPGQRTHSRDVVATIVDPDRLFLRLMLHESDYPDIHVDQPVTATLTAYPDDQFEGRVAQVAEVGRDRNDLSPIYQQSPATGQTLFLVSVELDRIHPRAKPGMTTHVEIEVEPARERLLIPGGALRGEAPPYSVVRRRDGREEEVPVEGRHDRLGRFEVASGLNAGDEVRVSRAERVE